MKSISLWQPYASLIAWGDKQIETRSWPTSYRGPLLIHAAKRWTREEENFCLSDTHCFAAMQAHNIVGGTPSKGWTAFPRLPKGAIIAVADLTSVFQIEDDWWETDGGYSLQVLENGRSVARRFVSNKEYAFGNYATGRFGWVLENIRALPEPVPCRGVQQLWTPSSEVIAAVEAQLKAVVG